MKRPQDMVELDLARFWEENAASLGRAFRTDKPRAPVHLHLDDHWLLEEMKPPSSVRYYHEPDYAAELHRRCNDRCEQIIGIRPFRETPAPKPPLRIEQVFGSHMEIVEGGTPWLQPGVETIEQLRDLLNRLERLGNCQLQELIFSNGGVVERQPARPDGSPAVVQPMSRGPATIGTSVIGTTRWLYWLIDHPADMGRFYDVLAETLIRYQHIIEHQSNVVYRGYAWFDDNCALLSPPLYERFCFPVLRRVFEEFAPGPSDPRYQHSDSAMAHLLPVLSRLDFHAVNFGPTVRVQDIRRHMPRTEIHGQIAPNTLRNGSLDDVVAEVRRDFDAVGHDGGLLLTTAGSISAGTSLHAVRGFMWAVDRFARYDGL